MALRDVISTIPMVGAAGSDISITSLFFDAHWLVKGVMLLLVLMFLVCLYIIIYKSMFLQRASRETKSFTAAFWKSRDIEQIYKQAQALPFSPVSQMFLAGYTELAKLSSDEDLTDDREGNLANIERALRKAQTAETTKLESMVPFLANTSSAAPFIGLFGTVMGILFAFQAMSSMKAGGGDTMKILGPHIAEALFATAIGLVAAIPAVMAYNFFTRRIRLFRSEMDSFEQDYLNIVKRHFLR